MSNGRKPAYLERHAQHSKMSVPPDDHHLSESDKVVVEDEAAATGREGAREREEARQAHREHARVIAAEDARKAASCEATANAAKDTFWQKMKDFFSLTG